MTDTEKAALCTRIDELCAELSRTQLNRDMWLIRAKVTLNSLSAAQAENARLCDENERLQSVVSDGADNARELRAENAKLRELVAEMFNACPMCVNCAHNHLTVGWYDRMRELGVEVDG